MPAALELFRPTHNTQDPCRDVCTDPKDCCDPCDALRTHQSLPKLGALHPTTLRPHRLPKRQPRPQARDAIKQIERLEVVKNHRRTDRNVYDVSIFYRDARSRIPVHGPFGRMTSALLTSASDRRSASATPSFTVQVAYEDLLQLRYDAYELARSSHLLDVCPFCQSMIDLNMTSNLKPRWNSHWHKTKVEVGEMLTAYLTDMLKLVVEVPTSGDDRCYGQRAIPRLLQRILRVQEHEQDQDQERRSM